MFLNLIKKLFRKTIYSKDIINVCEHDKIINQSSDVIVKYANFKNIKDTLDFQDKKYLVVFKKFLELNDIGYLGYIEDRCIHRSWVKKNNQIVHFHWAYKYKLKEDEVFIHYCETAKDVRGKNIFPTVLNTIVKDFLNKKLLIIVNKNNISSSKSLEKAGFKIKQTIKITIFMGMKFTKEITYD